MNMKKIAILVLSLCMIAAIAVTGTIAYFQDAEQANNTMVLGNIEIDIDEWTYEADEDGKREWKPFADDKFVLYPIDNAQGMSLYNKMVYTANVSPSKDAAYLRNIVLIEANTKYPTTKNDDYCCFPAIHFGYATNDMTKSETDGKTYYGSTNYSLDETVTINNKEYWVAVFEEKNGQAIPHDAALMSLNSVYIDENVKTEDIAGWGEDKKVDVIVFSQGIQATGLTHDEAMSKLGTVNEAMLVSLIKDESTDFKANDWTQKTK